MNPKRASDDGPESVEQVKRRTSRWWHRHLEPEERKRITDSLALRQDARWQFRFTMMLTLSVIVAAMGLLMNSAAVVIGAMLLAPMMQPVLAIGACLATSLHKKAAWAFLRLLLATGWCVAVAWIAMYLTPTEELTTEILTRTSPDIKDLVVALAAGLAGAYATVRDDVSASLPGVAVAVALVPPLAAAGALLESGETILAQGALLLYITNLIAIVFASISVFVVTGFVTPRRIAKTVRGVSVANIVLAALVCAVAYPLYQASVSSVAQRDTKAEVEDAVDRWIGGADLQRTVSVRKGKLIIVLQGRDRPPSQEKLESDLASISPTTEILVEWIRTEELAPPSAPLENPSDVLISRATPIIVEWLDANKADYELESVDLEGLLLRINVTGTGQPPPIDSLDDMLDSSIDVNLSPRLNWTTRQSLSPGSNDPSATLLLEERMSRTVQEWSEEYSVDVRGFVYDGEDATVELEGPQFPQSSSIDQLKDSLKNIQGEPGWEPAIHFFERTDL